MTTVDFYETCIMISQTSLFVGFLFICNLARLPRLVLFLNKLDLAIDTKLLLMSQKFISLVQNSCVPFITNLLLSKNAT